jgi:rRNA maturation RNase YbeY
MVFQRYNDYSSFFTTLIEYICAMDVSVDFTYQTDFVLVDEQLFVNWLSSCATQHDATSLTLVYAFMDDESLLELNRKYLNHNTLTDIITFDDTFGRDVNANIAVSVARIRENAEQLNVPFDEELLRVMSHGLLHCLGFKDKTDAQTIDMRKAENRCIELFHVEHKKENHVS